MNMNNNDVKFAGTPLCPSTAERLVANICEIAQKRLPDVECDATGLTQIFDMGADAFSKVSETEEFGVASELFLKTKEHLRRVSYREYKEMFNRMMRASPELRHMPLRQMETKDCIQFILRAYKTMQKAEKARRLLHCFFRFAVYQNWCAENIIKRIWISRSPERTVPVLTLEEVYRLLACAAQPQHRCCAAAVGLMLWCGIRPFEVTRLHWKDVDLDEKVVALLPRHSKTGGGRLVSLQPVVVRWLRKFGAGMSPEDKIAPPCWTQRWKQLRKEAGLMPWRSDTLRHTFASYHLRYFNNLARLQVEMGHSDSRLLFNRYLNVAGIKSQAAADFWCCSVRTTRATMRRQLVNG